MSNVEVNDQLLIIHWILLHNWTFLVPCWILCWLFLLFNLSLLEVYASSIDYNPATVVRTYPALMEKST